MFSEGEAFRRIVAARLGRRFPVVHSLLAAGSVHLSTLVLLRESLTEENHEELLVAVTRKTKREVEVFLASRFPRPDAPSRIREQARIEPLSEARYRVEFTASEELRGKIEHCRDLMSHVNPSRDLAVVVERAIDLLVAHLERKRIAKAKRPQERRSPRDVVSMARPQRSHRGPVSEAKRPHVSNAVRREVFERDGLQCTYVADDGRRCEARAFLELDHIQPKAAGGSDDVPNLRVRCRAHNQFWAEQAFGRESIVRARHLRQKKSTHEIEEQAPESKEQASRLRDARTAEAELPTKNGERDERVVVLEKVRLALCTMGFRADQSHQAIAAVVRMHETTEPLALEQVLREALMAATAA